MQSVLLTAVLLMKHPYQALEDLSLTDLLEKALWQRESASPCGVEFRQLRVKVAECCRGHAALIPGGSKFVLNA